LPAVVRALSAMQAFKSAESSGPYVGFIAGMLGSDASHAEPGRSIILGNCALFVHNAEG
jgi:hypothetical protein